MDIKAFDAHCHADILIDQEPDFVPTYRDMGLGGLTWSYARSIESWTDYPQYWEHLHAVCIELTRQGVPMYYLAGIHPRCIPQDLETETRLPGVLKKSLQDHLGRPQCRGLGELGLEKGGLVEERILRWQLDMALEGLPEDKKVGVHTPKQDKEAMTRAILKVVDEYPSLKGSVLIDHLSSQVWPLVWEAGYMAGMTLQPGKSTGQEVLSVLGNEPGVVDRLILNSDGAKEMSRPFVQAVQNGLHLDRDTQNKIFVDNAREFWGLW
ncbi:MAG: hypothetical protein R6U55_05140 [Desulfovermiculus sp.]